jgi:hypothetical protein
MSDPFVTDKKCSIKPATGNQLKHEHDEEHQHGKPGSDDEEQSEQGPFSTRYDGEETPYHNRNTERNEDTLQHKIGIRDQRDFPAPRYKSIRFLHLSFRSSGASIDGGRGNDSRAGCAARIAFQYILPARFTGTMVLLFPYQTLGPFHTFLGGESGDRVKVFPEALVRFDDHVIVHAHVRFSIDDDRLSTGTGGYIESFERTGRYPVSPGSLFRCYTETGLEFSNDPDFEIFCQPAFDWILLHTIF